MNIKTYPAIFHEEDGGYWVEFPDLKGCVTEGDTLEETMANAREVLGLFLATLAEDGTPIPKPSQLKRVRAKDGEATYIMTDVDEFRRDTHAVRKMVSLPAWLAKEAEERHISLSRVVQKALAAELELA